MPTGGHHAPLQSPPFQLQAPLLLPAASTAYAGPAMRSAASTAASCLQRCTSGGGLGSTHWALSKAPKMQGAHLLGHAEGTPPGALTPPGVALGWSLVLHAHPAAD